MDEDLTLIREQALFRGFSPEELREVLEELGGCTVSFEKGDSLNSLMDRQSPTALACILSGWALLLKYDALGNQAILDFAMPGYLLGCYKVLTGADFSAIRISATSPGRMLCFNGEKLLRAESAASHLLLSRLNGNILTMLAERSWRLLKKADIVSCHSLREKILSFLDSQRECYHSSSFEIPLDRQGLADYLYVNRSALSRELSKLRDEGLIDFHKSRFVLYF